MHQCRWIALALIAAPLAAMHLATAEGAATGPRLERPLLHKRVGDVLRELDAPAMRFIFSSQLVPDSLVVAEEPRPGDDLSVVRAVLAAHGLGLQEIQPGLYAVVRPADGATPEVAGAADDADATRAMQERLAQVVVSASRYRIGEAPGDASSVNFMDADSLREQAGLGDDPLRALQRLPGVAHNSLSVVSSVRGGDPSETLLLFDGFPLRRAYHLSTYQSLFSVIDAQLVDGAEVYTGGFPARYGNRMSAVFDMHSIDALAEPRGSLALDFFNASARVSGGRELGEDVTPLDWLAAGRVGTLKPLLHVFAPSAGRPTYADAYLRSTWGDVHTLRVTGNVLWGRDELWIEREQRGERGELENRSRYFWVRLDREWAHRWQATAWLGQTRLESRRDGDAEDPEVALGTVFDRRAARLTELRGRVLWQPHLLHAFEAGIEASDETAYYVYRAQATFDPDVAALFDRAGSFTRDVQLAPARRRGGGFLSYRWQATPSITAEIGGRAQRLFTEGVSPDWISEPRVGVRLQLAPSTRLQFSWGRFNQIDEINELAVEDGRVQFANPQRSEHFIAGLEHQLTPLLAMRLEAYEKRQTNPRIRYENSLDTQTVLPEIAPDRVAIQARRADIEGVEISLSRDDGALLVWSTGGWSRALDHVDGGWVARSWDQTWTFTLGARWKRGPWQLGGQFELHRGWPQTMLTRDAAGLPLLGPRNGERLPLFLELDLRAQYSRRLSHGELVWTAEIINATGHSNACCTELVLRNGELAGRTLPWLPIVPSLGVRWNF